MLDFSKFEVLTFDCYGTLIDWESGILQSLKSIFIRHGVGLPESEILEKYAQFEACAEQGEYLKYRLILQSVVESFGKALGFIPSPEELRDFPDSLQNWPAFPDTVAALQTLAKRYRLGIISNIDDDLFAHTAKRLRVRFDWVITAEQVGAYKPSTKNFIYAFDKIGIAPARILHVAQSLYHDHVPAKKLGLATVWVNRRKGLPGRGATPPAKAHPNLEAPDLKTLVEQIEA